MRRSKRSAAVLLCGISLLVKPAYAFWPVFDFTEIVPILQQVKTGKDSVDTIRNSLNSMNETKKAIGGIGSLASFSPNLFDDSITGMAELSGNASQTNQGAIQIASATPEIVEQAVSGTFLRHSETINSFVDEVQKKIFKNQTQNELVISYNDLSSVVSLYEEEEEEEEISDKSNKETHEALTLALNNVLSENKKLATELNDILETLLTVLNRAATVNTTSLAELKNAVKITKVISNEDKDILEKRIEALSEKQQNVTDRAAAIIENIKDNYNEEYGRTIKDGTGNYVKIATAYVNGDEEKSAVEEAGKKLKQDVASLAVVSDGENLKAIETISKDILAEAETLKAEMEEILKKK